MSVEIAGLEEGLAEAVEVHGDRDRGAGLLIGGGVADGADRVAGWLRAADRAGGAEIDEDGTAVADDKSSSRSTEPGDDKSSSRSTEPGEDNSGNGWTALFASGGVVLSVSAGSVRRERVRWVTASRVVVATRIDSRCW